MIFVKIGTICLLHWLVFKMTRQELNDLLHEASITQLDAKLLEIELLIVDEAIDLSGQNEYEFGDNIDKIINHFSDFKRKIKNSLYRGKIFNEYLDIFAEYCCKK